MCQIYSKLTIKTSERRLVLLLLTLNFAPYSTVNIAEFKQINAVGPEKGYFQTINEFLFNNCEKYIVLWTGKIYWAICFYYYSPSIRLRKDEFSRQHFKKIGPTLSLLPNLRWYPYNHILKVLCVSVSRKSKQSDFFDSILPKNGFRFGISRN